MHVLVPLVFIVTSFKCLECQTQINPRLNFFDTDLLRYAAEDRMGNVMVSPASIKSTLAMVLEGAYGNTALEIKNALRLSPNKNEFREQLYKYLQLLQTNITGAYLQNTNAVFFSNKLELKRDYEVMLQNVYSSQICRMNFSDPILATESINAWVNNRTMGLITSIIEPVYINPSTDILLVNAIYFKSSWQHAFNPQMTRSACFYDHGVCKKVAMMELNKELNYANVENLRAHALELPYEGGRYSMIVLVPHDRDGCISLIRDLPYMSLPQITNLLEPTDVQLSMPKFTIDYNDDMVAALNSMRITTLFTSSANLSGIFEGESPQINHIFHKVRMTVDETGTVAAAATSAMVIPLIESGVTLQVDRPFVFFIRDNSAGLVLFEGKIEEPTPYVEQNHLVGQPKKNTFRNTIKRILG